MRTLLAFCLIFILSTQLKAASELVPGELKEVEDAKPNIILREPGAESVEHVTMQANGRILATAPFVKVRFVNRPAGHYPTSIARDVNARVKFYDAGGTLLLDIAGRWADSDQPSVRDFRQSRNDLLKMEFGIEEEHSLDIAFRDTTGEFVAWNNDSYNFPNMRKPEHVLSGNRFRVDVKLSAAWIDKTFRFEFAATDENGIEIIRSPS